jgi:hypothetical protein
MMNDLHADTDPQSERILVELLRDAPEWRRIEIMCGMIEAVRQLVSSGVRQRHPDAGEDEVRHLTADILLGHEAAEKVYGVRIPGGAP